jgi:hypothetical protein
MKKTWYTTAEYVKVAVAGAVALALTLLFAYQFFDTVVVWYTR